MEYKYGGFWRRAFAFLIDNAILHFVFASFFVIGIAALGLGTSFARGNFSLGRLTGLTLAYLVVYHLSMGLISMFYFTYFHGIVGQTPGKMILRLKVLQANGQDLKPGIAFLRWVGYIVSGLAFNLGFIWIAFDAQKRGWHDMIARTIVVRLESATAASIAVPASAGADEKYLDKEGQLL